MSNFQLKVNIEKLWNAGKGPMFIAAELGCSRDYVGYIVNLMGVTRSDALTGNDDMHLDLIRQANRGRGFPVCVKR